MYTTASDQMLQCQPLPRPLVMERRWNSNAELAPNCPRCASSNTKFCYYNNYSLSQPRYFCKGCRRYWTKGGSLRNVPVGGGCRKTRRAKAAASARSPQDGRVFSTIITSSQSLNPGLPTTDPSPAAPPSRPCGSDIDLAAVFAKFLNQSSSVGDSELVGSNQEADHDRLLDGLPPQVFGGGDQNDQIQQEEQIQELLGHDLRTVIVDELAQDLLWSESDATLPVFSWQPMVEVELQEFGSFSSHDDDQSKISANIISDNWSLFDLPACL